jgi:hypothetical protein
MVAKASTSEEPQAATFLNFSFFRVDPKWRWLNEIGKEEAELSRKDAGNDIKDLFNCPWQIPATITCFPLCDKNICLLIEDYARIYDR